MDPGGACSLALRRGQMGTTGAMPLGSQGRFLPEKYLTAGCPPLVAEAEEKPLDLCLCTTRHQLPLITYVAFEHLVNRSNLRIILNLVQDSGVSKCLMEWE